MNWFLIIQLESTVIFILLRKGFPRTIKAAKMGLLSLKLSLACHSVGGFTTLCEPTALTLLMWAHYIIFV